MKKPLLLLSMLIMSFSLVPRAWSAIPTGPEVATKGIFGPVINWPIIPIHVTLLPNGNVLSFGSTVKGLQGGYVNAVWNPSLGTELTAHIVTPNAIHTDTFCAGQTVLSSTGETLMLGGDAKINNKRNYSIADANFFDPITNVTTPGSPMAFKRWYPSLVALANGDVVILGGRDERDIPTYASTPELYTPNVGFKSLSGAVSDEAYGKGSDSWRYPRGFLAPNGKVFIIGHWGQTYWLNPAGNGILAKGIVKAPKGVWSLPSVMYAPGKILSIRDNKQAVVFDLNAPTVTMKIVPGISSLRRWSNGTVLADGKVFVNGGSDVGNQLIGVAYNSEIWDPATEQWTVTASATIPRLYHSNALLLPDGSVLTGGGGAPGPLKNMNAEIYYPPYLYNNDGSGTPADRPTIDIAPDSLVWNQSFEVTYTSPTPVSRITFVRSGSATHSMNNDQRFMELTFSQTEGSANTLTVSGPTDRNIAPPGYYMMFIFDQNGVPSISKLVHLQD
jgi:Domain of unknown function (DUF1929)